MSCMNDKCSLCDTPLIEVGDAAACVKCDLMLEWPTVEHNPGVILMAHRVGVGRLPR